MDKKINNRLDRLLVNVGDMALKRRARKIVKELELKKGDKVLDIGCGDGFYLHLLSKIDIDLNLVGFDLSEDSLATAKKNLKNSSKLMLIQGDLMKGIPFENNSFDKIIMSEVLEHLPNDIKGLREVYRVLKPNGILSLSVPDASYPFFWDPVNWILERVFNTHIESGFWAGIWNQHIRLYKKNHLINLLNKVNFHLLKIEGVTFWCLPFNHYLVNFVARLFYSNSLSSDIASDVSKFNTSGKKNTRLASLAFFVVNFIDKLNDLWPVENGVSLFVKAKKENR